MKRIPARFRLYKVSAIPNKQMEMRQLFSAIGADPFALVHDLSNGETGIYLPEGKGATEIQRLFPGLVLSEAQPHAEERRYSVLSCFRRLERDEGQLMADLHGSGISEGRLIILFAPPSRAEIRRHSERAESLLSKREAGETHSVTGNLFTKQKAIRKELFYRSKEYSFHEQLLQMMNDASLGDGLLYKFFFIFDSGRVGEYIRNRFNVMGEAKLTGSIDEVLNTASRLDSPPLGTSYLKYLVNLNGTRISYRISTLPPAPQEGIALGTFMKDGVSDTGLPTRITPSALNLGFIISGLPGSGKTSEAMSVIHSLSGSGTRFIIISPTDEWDDFALSHNMHLIKPFGDSVPINFFRKPPGLAKERFYQALALVLSSAANSGPYQSPMEKCMLNAFKRVYLDCDEPDPVDLYGELESSIIELHAKRTGSGVKYTKHGENIRSALEDLREIIARPEYSVSKGIKIEELAEKGVLFNISNTSGTARSYVYAMIMNQIYSLASQFDIDGDNELRLLICLEEAQAFFGKEESPVVQDLRQRIQDFRKQGIGLMLLAHNANDIEVGVRRLCQNKLYLKQAPDSALFAARDLVFTYADQDDVALKLKLLESRVGALSCVAKEGSSKLTNETTFIRTADAPKLSAMSANPISKYMDLNSLRPTTEIDTELIINGAEFGSVVVLFLGEEVVRFGAGGHMAFRSLSGKRYSLKLLNRRGRLAGEMEIDAAPSVEVAMSSERL